MIGLLAVVLLAGATELKIVPPDPSVVLTDPEHRDDFVTFARQAGSVVRVREAYRSKDVPTQISVVKLEVVEQIAGAPIERLEIAASIWDVIAPQHLQREGATFLLLVRDRNEILNVQSNGVPFWYGSGIIPIIDGAVPDSYAFGYDRLLILRPVTLPLIRQQLRSIVVGK